jgi:hypothetical protein
MSDNPQVNLTADNFPTSAALFNNLGIGFGDIVDDMNAIITQANQTNDSTIVLTGQIIDEINVFQFILEVSMIPPVRFLTLLNFCGWGLTSLLMQNPMTTPC